MTPEGQRNHYAPPRVPNTNGDPGRRTTWRTRILLAALCAIPVTFAYYVGKESWRAHTLLEFCREVKSGISYEDMVALENRHWIEDSYLVQANFDGYVDQRHERSLEFRSHMMDPDFACVIGHDGQTIRFVQLLTLAGFDPN